MPRVTQQVRGQGHDCGLESQPTPALRSPPRLAFQFPGAALGSSLEPLPALAEAMGSEGSPPHRTLGPPACTCFVSRLRLKAPRQLSPGQQETLPL